MVLLAAGGDSSFGDEHAFGQNADMNVYGLYSSDRFSHQFGGQADGLPQAMWYFRTEWIALPHGDERDFRFCPDFQVDRDWALAGNAAATSAPNAAMPLLVWVAAPHYLNGARLDATATQVSVADARLHWSTVPRLPLNGAWFNAESAAFFSARTLRLRGTRRDDAFVGRSLWPEDYTLPSSPATVAGVDSAAGLRAWVRADTASFSVASLWQRTAGQGIAPGQAVFGLMLNGAQGDDDEAHGGHFALLTGRVGEGGSIADLLVYNFYTLDAESEKGIVAAPVPLDNYLGDLNSGQAWYRPSWLLLATLADDAVPRRVDALMARVFAQFYKHCFTYRHAQANCAGISVRCLRALGWPVPALGGESWLRAFLALPLVALRERSLKAGKATFDYLTEDRTTLYPAQAFEQIGGDLLRRLQAGEPPANEWMRRLASDVQQVLAVHVPQFPSSRVPGSWPVVCSAEYRQRVPADPAARKIIPVPPRPFPAALRDPHPPFEATPRSEYAWRLYLLAILAICLLILGRLLA